MEGKGGFCVCLEGLLDVFIVVKSSFRSVVVTDNGLPLFFNLGSCVWV